MKWEGHRENLKKNLKQKKDYHENRFVTNPKYISTSRSDFFFIHQNFESSHERPISSSETSADEGQRERNKKKSRIKALWGKIHSSMRNELMGERKNFLLHAAQNHNPFQSSGIKCKTH